MGFWSSDPKTKSKPRTWDWTCTTGSCRARAKGFKTKSKALAYGARHMHDSHGSNTVYYRGRVIARF